MPEPVRLGDRTADAGTGSGLEAAPAHAGTGSGLETAPAHAGGGPGARADPEAVTVRAARQPASARCGYARTVKYIVGCQNAFILWNPTRVPASAAP
jgi:hypothetical protein